MKKTASRDAAPALHAFLAAWRDGASQLQGEHIQRTFLATQDDALEWTRTLLSRIPLRSWVIVGASQLSPVLVRFRVRCSYHGSVRDDIRTVTLVKELGSYEPSELGTWGVNPVSLLNVTRPRA